MQQRPNKARRIVPSSSKVINFRDATIREHVRHSAECNPAHTGRIESPDERSVRPRWRRALAVAVMAAMLLVAGLAAGALLVKPSSGSAPRDTASTPNKGMALLLA